MIGRGSYGRPWIFERYQKVSLKMINIKFHENLKKHYIRTFFDNSINIMAKK